MPITDLNDRKRAFDYGFPFWPYPFPKGEIDGESRAHIWGSFHTAAEPVPPSPYYISNHVERTLALLIEQFKPAQNLKDIVTVIVDQLQICEDVANQLIMMRMIDTSQGVQLDAIGEIVGEARAGRDDETYRNAIGFKIFFAIHTFKMHIFLIGARYKIVHCKNVIIHY